MKSINVTLVVNNLEAFLAHKLGYLAHSFSKFKLVFLRDCGQPVAQRYNYDSVGSQNIKKSGLMEASHIKSRKVILTCSLYSNVLLVSRKKKYWKL